MQTLFGSSLLGADPGPSPPASTVAFDYSAGTYSGQFRDAVGSFAYRLFDGLDSRCDGVFTGTQLVLSCYSVSTGSSEASIDGGAWADFDPAAFNTLSVATVATGLADASHTFAIRCKGTPGFFYINRAANSAFSVTGSGPACGPDPTQAGTTPYVLYTPTSDLLGYPGNLSNIRLECGYAATTISSPAYKSVGPTAYLLGSTNAYGAPQQGGQVRFYATVGSIGIWTYCNGSKWALTIDGALQSVASTPNSGRWQRFTIQGGLDSSSQHLYAIVGDFWPASAIGSGSGAVHTIFTTGGTGINTSSRPPARPRLLLYGDSIPANNTALTAGGVGSGDDPSVNSVVVKWQFGVSEGLGLALVDLGIGSTTVHDYTGNLGSLPAPNVEYVTTDSGEARTNNLTDLAPASSDRIAFLYGTNDVGRPYASSGLPNQVAGDYQVSFQAMVAATVAGSDAATQTHVFGILPRSAASYGSGASDADRLAWNAAAQVAISAVGAANVRYHTSDTWGLNTTTDTVDGLHPGPSGFPKIVAGMLAAMGSTPAGGPIPIVGGTLTFSPLFGHGGIIR